MNTLPIPAIDVVRREYGRALAQLETRFTVIDLLMPEDVLMMNTYIGITEDTTELMVTPCMRAEDCLEELLTVIMNRERSQPCVVNFKGTKRWSKAEQANINEWVKRGQRDYERVGYAEELMQNGVHPMTAHALSVFLLESRPALIEYMDSLHPLIYQPEPGP